MIKSGIHDSYIDCSLLSLSGGSQNYELILYFIAGSNPSNVLFLSMA